MEERSFLLFKPNQFISSDVYQYIINRLKDNELLVEKEYALQLTSWQLCNLWPHQCKDRLLYHAMIELYAGYINIIEIFGENAIKKVNKIKVETRAKYATGIIRNCIHAPVSSCEYDEHIKIIRDKFSRKKPIFNNLVFDCYKDLNGDVCKELAEYIIDIGLYTMIHSTIPYENSTNKFRYYLAEDEIHTFTDYVCFICDTFQNFDFRMACVLATILKTYGEVCLIDTNDERSADLLVENGKSHNMTIKRHEVKNITK